MGNARRPSFKGHCAMCALNTDGRIRGLGWSARMTAPERRLVGRARRVSRGEIPGEQLVGDLTWAPRVVDGQSVLWTDYEVSEPEVVEIDPDWRPGEHFPVNAAPTHDTEGWRLFGPIAEVCRACSDFEAGRLVPVSFCAEALAAAEVSCVDVDAILESLGPEFDDPGEDPWGGANLEPFSR